jgi:hypothetical protein
VSYKITGSRPCWVTGNGFPDKKKKSTFENDQEIIDFSLNKTADLLSFTTSKCETKAYSLVKGGKTNCIGYAGLCNFICDSNLRKLPGEKFISGTYTAQLYIFGYNIHHLFNSPFWKDHDVVVITNTTTGKRTLLDPTLYDYTGVGIVRERK